LKAKNPEELAVSLVESLDSLIHQAWADDVITKEDRDVLHLQVKPLLNAAKATEKEKERVMKILQQFWEMNPNTAGLDHRVFQKKIEQGGDDYARLLLALGRASARSHYPGEGAARMACVAWYEGSCNDYRTEGVDETLKTLGANVEADIAGLLKQDAGAAKVRRKVASGGYGKYQPLFQSLIGAWNNVLTVIPVIPAAPIDADFSAHDGDYIALAVSLDTIKKAAEKARAK